MLLDGDSITNANDVEGTSTATTTDSILILPSSPKHLLLLPLPQTQIITTQQWRRLVIKDQQHNRRYTVS
jgi:hypothetical protein